MRDRMEILEDISVTILKFRTRKNLIDVRDMPMLAHEVGCRQLEVLLDIRFLLMESLERRQAD